MSAEIPNTPEIRARILTAAAELFAEHGFGGASVDQIARRAEVNKAMLYYHIGDKAELFTCVLEEYIEAVRQELVRVTSETKDPEKRIRRMQAAMLAVFRRNPAFPGMMVREIAAGGANLPKRVLAKLGQLVKITFEVVEDGQERGVFREVNPILTHMMLVGTSALFMNAMRLRARLDEEGVLPAAPRFKTEELGEELSEIILHGISRPKKAGGKK